VTTITISRQYGSEGDEIAARVTELLGYSFFDKRLIAHLATEIGLQVGEVVDFSADEYEPRSFLERLLERDFGPRVCAEVSIWRQDASGAEVEETRELDEPQCIGFIQSALLAAHERGDVVIVGRGGQALLQDRPGVLHVRVEAPLRARIDRVQAAEGVSPTTARRRISESDRASADYVRHFYDADWSDPMLYHLTINIAKMDTEAAAGLIAETVGRMPAADSSD
jgi:cytidylate kinase